MFSTRYRSGLQTATAATATAYGYTLTIWTSGAVLTHARGIPSTLDALLFMLGAVGGFATASVASHGGVRRPFAGQQMDLAVWQGFHALSVAAAIGAASVVAYFAKSWAAWPIDGFVATLTYLAGVALLVAVGQRPQAPVTTGGGGATPTA